MKKIKNEGEGSGIKIFWYIELIDPFDLEDLLIQYECLNAGATIILDDLVFFKMSWQ